MRDTATYTYEFCTEQIEITGIDPEWIKVLEDMDREERNNTQRERRRHVSLDALDPAGDKLESGEDIESLMAAAELIDAIQQALTDRQLMVFELRFCQGLSGAETARELGVSPCTVAEISRSIRRKAQQILTGGAA